MLNYIDDDYSQGYGQNEEAVRALTELDIPKPYITENDSTSSNDDGDNIGYNLHVFDRRYHKNLENAQQNKVEFKLSEKIDSRIYGFALVLRNKLVSIGSDGQRHFDLI